MCAWFSRSKMSFLLFPKLSFTTPDRVSSIDTGADPGGGSWGSGPPFLGDPQTS